MRPFRFGVHTAVAPTMQSWRERARVAESMGYSALYVTDHLDQQFGPLVAATVAAEATERLHVGTLVLNNDFRNPVVLAKEIATLGLAAEGRIEVGLGAGWLRGDYDEAGISWSSAADRVDRLRESVTIMNTLWSTGVVTLDGISYYRVRGARCDPRPSQIPRLLIGGGSERILRLAAERADTVGINTNLASGDAAHATATLEHFDRCLEWVRSSAADRFDDLEVQVTAFSVMVVGSRRAAARSATMLGYSGEESLELPIVLIGTHDEMCERLIARRERWGFSNIVIPGESMVTFAPIVERLSGR